jgi:hypothetical protein
MSDGDIVYVVMTSGSLDTVWSTPEAAMDRQNSIHGGYSYIAVRPVGLTRENNACRAARTALRLMGNQREK